MHLTTALTPHMKELVVVLLYLFEMILSTVLVHLNTNLQAVAVKVTLSFVFTICSLYCPPNNYIDSNDLEHLLSQIHGPVMMLGDFNSHNPLWGSDHITPKGRVVENFISQNDLCLFNDGSYTFLHSGNGSYSAIDLSFASPTLFDRFSWGST